MRWGGCLKIRRTIGTGDSVVHAIEKRTIMSCVPHGNTSHTDTQGESYCCRCSTDPSQIYCRPDQCLSDRPPIARRRRPQNHTRTTLINPQQYLILNTPTFKQPTRNIKSSFYFFHSFLPNLDFESMSHHEKCSFYTL